MHSALIFLSFFHPCAVSTRVTRQRLSGVVGQSGLRHTYLAGPLTDTSVSDRQSSRSTQKNLDFYIVSRGDMAKGALCAFLLS
jgi:hypothetical protein